MRVLRAVAVAWIWIILWLSAATAFADERTAPDKLAVITVKGLACPFCVHGLEKHLRRLPGAKDVSVSLSRGQAKVTFDGASKVTDEQIKRAVRKAGFSPGKIEWRVANPQFSRQERIAPQPVILSRRSAAKHPLPTCAFAASRKGSFAVYAAQDDRMLARREKCGPKGPDP